MTGKRFLSVAALAALLSGGAGCRSWCERQYPCVPACQPCAPAPVISSAPPPPPPAGSWTAPRSFTCTCQ
jgi:hypothetical protein